MFRFSFCSVPSEQIVSILYLSLVLFLNSPTKALSFFEGHRVLALPVGRPTAGHRSDCAALDGDRNIVSRWDGRANYPPAFAKLRGKVVLILPVRDGHRYSCNKVTWNW